MTAVLGMILLKVVWQEKALTSINTEKNTTKNLSALIRRLLTLLGRGFLGSLCKKSAKEGPKKILARS